MSTPTVEQRVARIVREESSWEGAITPTLTLIGDLQFDSLDCISFVMGIEKEFNIDIDDESAEKFKTVGDVLEYLGHQGMT